MEATDFFEEMKAIIPSVHTMEKENISEFHPSPPGINSLCSRIGWFIAEKFSSINKIDDVFRLIETGMRDGSNDLKDAISTGLIEAIISQSDYDPGKWEEISPHLGPISAAYARDWIKFTETGRL